MNSLNLKKLAAVAVLGMAAILGASQIANAQGNPDRDRHDNDKYNKQREKGNKQNARAEQKRIRLAQQRQADWSAQKARVLAEQQRQIQWSSRNTGGANFDWRNNSIDRNARYRVYRNGSYYQTDYRGIELLRQAVNEGYRQGFRAGRSDRGGNVRFRWSNSNVYRSGTYGYTENYVSRSQYQYYFQQGFQRGYVDGSNSRYDNDHNGQYDYGYYEDGSMNILGTILNTVLNIRSY